jgi:MFS family permease
MAERSGRQRSPRVAGRTWALALAVAMVLADSSVVVLALPDLLDTFGAGIDRTAWVITAFNAVLAVTAVPCALLARRHGAGRIAGAGAALFAAASVACALANGIDPLIAARCVQAVGGAALVASAIELLSEQLGDEKRAARVWTLAAAIGVAVGPMIGGLLTEAFDWRAIFVAQVPVVLLVPTLLRTPRRPPADIASERPDTAVNLALCLLSAALTAALFLLVLLIVEGFGRSPLAAAVVVSVIPIASVIVLRVIRGERNLATRAASGSLLIAGGLAALGLLPGGEPAWTLAPQAAIGAGLALAVPALTHLALEKRPLPLQAAWTIGARHLGVVLGLAILTPVLTADITHQEVRAENAGAAIVLDARLPFSAKLELGDALQRQAEASGAHVPDLGPVFAQLHPSPTQKPIYASVEKRLEDQVRRAVTHAFSRAFLIAALLALLAVVPIATVRSAGRLGVPAIAAACVVAVALPLTGLALGARSYAPAAAPDACAPRTWGPTSGVQDVIDQVALSALNGAACRLHVPAATLALALSSDARMQEFRQQYHVDDDAVGAAVRDGLQRAIDDGQRSGALNGAEAFVLGLALRGVPESWLRDQVPRIMHLVQ